MTCECTADGFCNKYQRPMVGRLREICRGENIDPIEAEKHRAIWSGQPLPKPVPMQKCPHLGEPITKDGENVKQVCIPCGGKKRQVFSCTHPARQPDQVTVADCSSCIYKPVDSSNAEPLILKNHLSPGDVLCMTAAIHSLHAKYPGKYKTAVQTSCNAIFEHNPHVTSAEDMAKVLDMHYPLINHSNQYAVHVMQGYCDYLESQLGVRLPLMTNRPHVYLSKQERIWIDQVQEITKKKQRFWLINAGRKNDYTCKFWGTENYQSVVDALRGKILFVQVGSAEHYHPPLRNVLNLIGKTDTRQLIRLAYHADGGVGGVTFLQHLCAALEKPYVCIMGGREPVSWNTYPRQQLLHTIGMLPCCKSGGCWKSRVERLGDGSEQDNSLCDNPVIGDEAIPKCMALIRHEEVIEKVLTFNT